MAWSEFERQEHMEADHIKPWHEGGKTVSENCQQDGGRTAPLRMFLLFKIASDDPLTGYLLPLVVDKSPELRRFPNTDLTGNQDPCLPQSTFNLESKVAMESLSTCNVFRFRS